jgi:hypothetical protein
MPLQRDRKLEQAHLFSAAYPQASLRRIYCTSKDLLRTNSQLWTFPAWDERDAKPGYPWGWRRRTHRLSRTKGLLFRPEMMPGAACVANSRAHVPWGRFDRRGARLFGRAAVRPYNIVIKRLKNRLRLD